jgi:hypothetical protein
MDEKAKNIVEKVSDLYLQFGIKGVTMDDVAHHITISKKTLYQYFKDKKELVWAVLEHNDCEKKIDLSIFEQSSSNAIDDLFSFYNVQVEMIKSNKPAFVYDLKKYYPEIFLHFQKIKHKRVLESITNNLLKGKKEGLYRSDINEDILSRLSLMRIEGIMNTDFFSAEEIVSTDFFSEIFKYNVFGIVSDKGRKMLDSKLDQINL